MEIRQAALLRPHHPAVGSKCCRATSAPPVCKDETGLNAKRNGRRVRRGHESYNGRQRHRCEGELKPASENSSQKFTTRFQAAKQSDRQSDSGHHNSHGTASRTRDIADLALDVVPMIDGLGEGHTDKDVRVATGIVRQATDAICGDLLIGSPELN